MNDFRERSAIGEKDAYSVAGSYAERREPARHDIRARVQFGVRESRSVRRHERQTVSSAGSAPWEPE
jgi:hypothetical protein